MAMNMQTGDIILMKMEMWWNDRACEADYAPPGRSPKHTPGRPARGSYIFLYVRTKGVLSMGKATKKTRIKRELDRLNRIFEDLPENKRELIAPLIENSAFMKVTLEDLKDEMDRNGCTEEYKNGQNQFGVKVSAATQAYNTMIKNYNTVNERLEKVLPPEKRRSKLAELRDE